MRTRGAIAIVLAVAAVAGLALVRSLHVRADGASTLRRAYESAQRASYTGTVTTAVFYMGREFRTQSAVLHRGGEERIKYLSGPVAGVLVVARRGETRTYQPGARQVIVSRAPGGRSDGAALDLLLANYAASLAGSGRVAGRSADIVAVTPRRRGNPSKKLWIDRGTGVILRSEDRSASGELRSRTEFTAIRCGASAPSAAFEPTADIGPAWTTKERDRELTQAELQKAVGLRVVPPQYLPPGYVPDGMNVYSCACGCGHKAAHLRYTDGLNSISVFETPAHPACGSAACSVHCPTTGRCQVRDARQARVATASSGTRSIVVVADLPEEEIARVAKSIQ